MTKFTITIEVPDNATLTVADPASQRSVELPPAAQFEDELVPWPAGVMALPEDATARQLMAQAVNTPPGFAEGTALVRTMAQNPSQDICPVHRVPWKLVPAGVSKKSGKPYDAFRACPERGCDQRPAA